MLASFYRNRLLISIVFVICTYSLTKNIRESFHLVNIIVFASGFGIYWIISSKFKIRDGCILLKSTPDHPRYGESIPEINLESYQLCNSESTSRKDFLCSLCLKTFEKGTTYRYFAKDQKNSWNFLDKRTNYGNRKNKYCRPCSDQIPIINQQNSQRLKDHYQQITDMKTEVSTYHQANSLGPEKIVKHRTIEQLQASRARNEKLGSFFDRAMKCSLVILMVLSWMAPFATRSRSSSYGSSGGSFRSYFSPSGGPSEYSPGISNPSNQEHSKFNNPSGTSTNKPLPTVMKPKSWQRVCAKYDQSQQRSNPKVPQEVVNRCRSHEFYYGFNSDPDYLKAIECAHLEIKAGDNFIIGGSGVLMMAYTNGYGVEKNLAKAIMYACRILGSEAEMEGRIEHLQKLFGNNTSEIFDICQDATSGRLQGECQYMIEGIARKHRHIETLQIMSNWTAAEVSEFKKLQAIAEDYYDKRTTGELDPTPSARWMYVHQERGNLETQFLKLLKEVEKGTFQSIYKEMDKELNNNYKTLIPILKLKKWSSTPSEDNVRKTQRAWIKYRDAWAKFISMKYPKTNKSDIVEEITKMRNDQLKLMVKNN